MHTRLSVAILLCVAAFGRDPNVQGADPERSIYQLGIALNQMGLRGYWSGVGQPQGWKGVRAGTILNDRLYTAHADGTLRVTTIPDGKRNKIGDPAFGETKFMFAAGGSLWTIEQSGTLYRVNPADGAWSPVGADGAWQAVRRAAVLGGRLFTAESNGALYAANLTNGRRAQIGKPEFGNVAALLARQDRLWMIDDDGNLYRIDAQSGARERIGPLHGWKGLVAAAMVQDQLYTIHADGTLRETQLPAGTIQTVGKPDFAETAFMFAGGKQTYTIEYDGTLYEVFLHPEESINGWDCFPREFEKVFQEQAKNFYRTGHARQLLGRQATLPAIMQELAQLQAEATAADLVVLYFTSHGGTDAQDGWCAETADGQMLWGHDLKAQLAKLRCHALVFLETCGSGGFAQSHQHDPSVPANVTVLCACLPKQAASNELDIAALEGLWGLADFSRDGTVDLDELLRYVEARYQVMCPTPNAEGQLLRPVIARSKSMPGSLPLTQASAQLGSLVHDGALYAALVSKREGDRFPVHVLGFNNQPGLYFVTKFATRDCLCLPHEGPPLEVEQNGEWYPARLVGKQGDRFKVHYLGYQEEEVVPRRRVRRAFVALPDADERLKN